MSMIHHACSPDRWCSLCDHNERHGGTRNHPTAPRRPATARKSLPARGPCLHLGVRTEFVPGCGGWRCSHECEAGEPVAVPGGVCQSCPKWEPESPTEMRG